MSSCLLFLRSLASKFFGSLVPLLLVFSILSLSACQKNYNLVGKFPDADDVEKLVIGESDRSSVAKLLGTPSHISNFSDNHWYYISQKQDETIKFRSQKVQQVVLVLMFD